MSTKQNIVICAGLVLACLAGPALAASGPEALEKEHARLLAAQKKLAQEAEKLHQERANLLDQIERTRQELAWTRFNARRYEGFNEQRQEAIHKLKRKNEEFGRLEARLEPFLAQVVKRLAQTIERDLDFLPRERSERVAFLEASLADYRLDLAEKSRRVFEALRVEAGYGRLVSVYDQEVEFEGRVIEAQVMHLGRLALFFSSPDGQTLGWQAEKGQEWLALPLARRQDLIQAMDMTRRATPLELVTLPVGKAQP